LSIKKILYRGSRSPSTPSKKQFDELIKGCEFIMHQAVFMSKELQDLRAESQVQKQKKSRSKCQMTPNQGLQVQEARDAIASRNKKLNKQGGSIDFCRPYVTASHIWNLPILDIGTASSDSPILMQRLLLFPRYKSYFSSNCRIRLGCLLFLMYLSRPIELGWKNQTFILLYY
jgi:hypothetical protein